MKRIFFIHLFAFLLCKTSFAAVRTVTPKTDEIIPIRLSIGMATLVYTPTPLLPSIIGDQSAFRIDMLPDFMSIKPLRYGAKTNLFVMTEKKRFNLHLQTVPQGSSDDIVYIKETLADPSVRWQQLEKIVQDGSYSLSLSRIGLTAQNFILLELKMTSKNYSQINPNQFWVLQGTESKKISHLYLSDKAISSEKPLILGFAISKLDLTPKKAISVEYRGFKRLTLTISENFLWK